MTNRVYTKSRIVKCPRCSNILQEPDQYPLYTCGGCGTILEAKHYKGGKKSTGFDSREVAAAALSNDAVHSGESSGFSQRSSPVSGQLGKNEAKDQNALIDHNSEKIGEIGEHDVLQKEEEPESENSDSKNKEQCDGFATENYNQKHMARVNSSKESSSIDECLLERKDPHPFSSDYQKQVVDANPLRAAFASNGFLVTESKEKECNGSDHQIDGENRKEPLGDELSREKIPNLAEEEEEKESNENPHGSVDCINEQLGGMKLSEASLSTEVASIDSGEIISFNVSPNHQCESNSWKNVRQKIRGSDDDSSHISKITRSCHNSKASDPINAGKENGIPRSLTKGSLAYDGSVSSFGENDDQVSQQQGHANEMSPKPKKLVASKESYHSSGFRSRVKSSSLVLLPEKPKRSTFKDELVEENSIPVRNNWIRPNRDRFMHRVPLYRSAELGYETGNSSSYIIDEPPIHRMCHHHRSKYGDLDPWGRKINVQIRGIDQRRFSDAILPAYNNNYETSGEIYHRSRHHGYSATRDVENWSRTRSGSLNRVYYSSEMSNEMFLQPNILRWDPYDPCPVRPQSFMEPKPYPWGPHAPTSVFENRRRLDHILRRLHLRENQETMKRQSYPLAGGSPFVTCYFCLKILQLPGNFLSKRRTIIHRLKCSACSNILEFCLENETGLAPCTRKDADSVEVGCRETSNEQKTERLDNAGDQSFRGRQMKVTWKLPSQRSKSPLHRLMGYSSPEDMFNGLGV